jgi:hypothetical protein
MMPSGRQSRQNRPKNSGRSRGRSRPRSRGVESGRLVPSVNVGDRNLLGLPQSYKVVLCLPVVNLPLTTGNVANDVYDSPIRFSSAYNNGTSAVGYAKLIAFYSKCYVVGSSAKFTCTNISSSTSSVIGMTVTTGNTTFNSASAAIANGMCRWSGLQANPDTRLLTQRCNVKKFMNARSDYVGNTTYASTSGADPSQMVFLHLWTATNSANAVTSNFSGEILLECVFTDPIPFT